MRVIEDSNKSKEDQNDLYDNFKKIKSNIKTIELYTDRGIINIPIWYSMNAQIKYFDAYEKFKDYRKAFCFLILSMVEDNIPQIKQSIDDININDIYIAKDTDLINVLELIIAKSDNLTEYYSKKSTGDYFEDFYNSIIYEKNKYLKKFEESFKILKSLENTIKSISKITIPTYVTESFQEVNKFSNQIANIWKNITNYNCTHDLIKSIQFQHEDAINNLAKITANIAKSFADITNSVNSINAIKKIPKKIKEINTELLKFGWYTFGEFSMEEINKLYNIIDEYRNDNDVNKYRKNVNKIMNEFIDEESEKLIKKILKTFSRRYKIIKDAYNAHKRGLYTLSIPVFLTQLDGICKEILGVSLYSKSNNEPKTKNELESLLKDNNIEVKKYSATYFMLYYPLEVLSSLIINTWDIDKKYNNNEIYSKFNRHAIIHGTDIKYNNRTNSNKCIAILSYLCDLKEEIDEMKKS